jgi:hypothetical protein
VKRSVFFALIVGFVACAADKPAVRTSMPVLSAAKAPASGSVSYFIGGDSRGDRGGVTPWAFAQARAVEQTRGFIFLGDMEWSHGCGHHFEQETQNLGTIPLYPALGNHEVRWFGWLKFNGAEQQRIEDEFTAHFLTPHGIVPGPAEGSPRPLFYAVDLETGSGKKDLRFIALDNVSLAGGGFGESQIQWLVDQLRSARERHELIIVGMHKPFAGNCTGKHSMEEDGARAIAESKRVLALLAGNETEPAVNAVFASHDHYFAEFDQLVGNKRLKSYVTGGLGAHLKTCSCGECADVHHVLQLDVADPVLGDDALTVSLIRWHGPEARFKPGHEDDEDDEDDGETIWHMTCERDGAGTSPAHGIAAIQPNDEPSIFKSPEVTIPPTVESNVSLTTRSPVRTLSR